MYGAAYKLLADETRIVNGLIGSHFSTKVSLPGVYTKFTYGKNELTISDQDCSCPLFNCRIIQESSDMAIAIINGTMSKELDYITFSGDNSLVPITVFFLINNTWSHAGTGDLQPQEVQPLIVKAKGKTTVTLKCSMSGWPIYYYFYTSVKPTVYYERGFWGPTNKTSTQPQILSFDIDIAVTRIIGTVTVKQNQSIDFYTCKCNDKWLTHTIDWSK
ncbi:unnamed protein product [Dibothriocephalus latus]|uniref:Uncharacterized protein n=1 Tax=Dibothriocephalus latus TaxID=60516 RepID=A0A3P7LMV0_DIBLA|nr:unnamed protein product [Dibothriocephalus latus]